MMEKGALVTDEDNENKRSSPVITSRKVAIQARRRSITPGNVAFMTAQALFSRNNKGGSTTRGRRRTRRLSKNVMNTLHSKPLKNSMPTLVEEKGRATVSSFADSEASSISHEEYGRLTFDSLSSKEKDETFVERDKTTSPTPEIRRVHSSSSSSVKKKEDSSRSPIRKEEDSSKASPGLKKFHTAMTNLDKILMISK